MSRNSLLGLAAIAVIGASLAMTPSANAFHGGSSGGGFFGGGSHGSHGGSFGGLFHRHHGSSGGSHGNSSCGCDCNGSDDAREGNHDNGDHGAVSDRDERSMEAPSREVRRDANGVIITEGDRDGRHHDADVKHDSDKDNHHEKNADRKHDDTRSSDAKKDNKKDNDKNDKDRATDSDKEKKNNSK